MRNPLATWSLRRRLTFGILLLTAAGYVISGVIAQQALKGYLLHQVDSQLVALSGGTLPRVAAFGIAVHETDSDFKVLAVAVTVGAEGDVNDAFAIEIVNVDVVAVAELASVTRIETI